MATSQDNVVQQAKNIAAVVANLSRENAKLTAQNEKLSERIENIKARAAAAKEKAEAKGTTQGKKLGAPKGPRAKRAAEEDDEPVRKVRANAKVQAAPAPKAKVANTKGKVENKIRPQATKPGPKVPAQTKVKKISKDDFLI